LCININKLIILNTNLKLYSNMYIATHEINFCVLLTYSNICIFIQSLLNLLEEWFSNIVCHLLSLCLDVMLVHVRCHCYLFIATHCIWICAFSVHVPRVGEHALTVLKKWNLRCWVLYKEFYENPQDVASFGNRTL
jgi:hypothetical protein